MNNVMKINGHQAVIVFDPEIELFRGEFIGLNGGADFYAPDVAGLQREGAISLEVFLKACNEKGIEPFKNFSGKFVLRVDPAIHEAAALAAAAGGKSLNQWAADILQISLRDSDNAYALAA
jgi:predicted HicB family RNase H-like nuclease